MDKPEIFFNNQIGKKYIVKDKNKYIEENSLLSGDANKDFLGSIISQNRLNIWLAIIVIIFVIIFVRLWQLQFFNGEYYRGIAEGNRIRNLEIKASRGLIYDRNGIELVKNAPNFIVELTPIDLPKEDDEISDLAEKLSNILKLPKDEILEKIDSLNKFSYKPVIFGDNLSHQQAVLVGILNNEFSGVALVTGSRREYNLSEHLSLSHLIGYTGKLTEKDIKEKYEDYVMNDYIGKSGIEYYYEAELKGIKGREQIEVDALGRRKEILAHTNPLPGKDIVLSIDLEAQKELESILKNHLHQKNKSKASAIIINPHNGEIIAMVSLPSFDINVFSRGISSQEFTDLINDEDKPMFNRSISGAYPSGSTIKMVVAAGALDQGIININTNFYSSGGIRVNRWFFPDWKAGGHGYTNVIKALSESVNTYFYIIGGGHDKFQGLGLSGLIKYFNLVGAGQRTGIDLLGEASGLLPDESWKWKSKSEMWYIGDTYHLSIGQGYLLVTPLQVAVWTSIFANDGTVYKPHLAKGYIKPGDSQIVAFDIEKIKEDVFKKESIEIVKRGLREAVVSGSSRRLYGLPVKVAGKTGTAQWSSIKDNHSWFTGFAPYDNPEFVITILVEEGGEGSQTAVPIAYDFINWWAENKKQN